MVGIRRARQLMAGPAQAAPPVIVRDSLDALRVPAGTAAGANSARALAAAGAVFRLNAARGYLCRLRMPRNSTADRRATTQVLLTRAAQTTVLESLTSEGSDAHDRVWAVSVGGGQLSFRTALDLASRAGARWDSSMTLSACALTVWGW